jgi:hypothetical protein
MAETDFTAQVRDRLLDGHDTQAEDQDGPEIEQRLQEARRKYPSAVVTWDEQLQDVVVDLSSGRR